MIKKLRVLICLLLLTGCHVKEYTVTFEMDDGVLLDSVKIPSGETIEGTFKPEKDGYIFVAWERDGVTYNEKTPVKEDITLKASWTLIPDLKKEYKVVFDVNDEKEEVIVSGKSLVSKPKDPEIKYYNFIGWYDGDSLYDFETPVNKDLYLVARFEKKMVNITFELNGGSGISKTKVEAGTTLKKPDVPKKLGYNFVGWYYLGKIYNFNSIVENDLELTAKWTAIEYVTVRYKTLGGTLINSETIVKGEKVRVPNEPKKDGYEFLYWQYNGVKYDFTLPVNETIELIAVYQEILASE